MLARAIDSAQRFADTTRAFYGQQHPAWRATLNLLVSLRCRKLTWAYLSRIKHAPNYLWPETFSEKVQYRKLFDHNPRFAIFCDKIAARDYAVAAAPDIGLTKLLWTGADVDAMPIAEIAPPFVIKPNNSCKQIIFVREPRDLDLDHIRNQCRAWMSAPAYGASFEEWGYGQTDRKIIVEEMLEGESPDLPPPDYKFFVFAGKVELVYFSTGRHRDEMGIRGYFDRDWNFLPFNKFTPQGTKTLTGNWPKPPNLKDMIAVAERIGKGIDFVRVDLYLIDGRPVLGELTAYPYSGMCFPVPKDSQTGDGPSMEGDRALGRLWSLPLIPLRQRLLRGLFG